MLHKHFRIVCLIRVASLCATVYLFFYLLFETQFYATLLIMTGVIAGQTWALIHYVERTNRDLTRFLQAIRYEDFSQSFIRKELGSSFSDLKTAFNEVLDRFRQTRAEREENYRYLQAVIQHVAIGLLGYRKDGNIILSNAAAARLLRTNNLNNISDLESFSSDLANALATLAPRKRALVKVTKEGQDLFLSLYATDMVMRGQEVRLVSIQNIQRELEEKEMEAWHNLIRVLTHEIMNSVTPIASLASTVNDSLAQQSASSGTEKDDVSEDIREAVATIERRSRGLLHFVDTYRELTRIPTPDIKLVRVDDLLKRVEHLMRPQLSAGKVRLERHVDPPSLEIAADPELIEQVLINLVLNAIQAMNDKPDSQIRMSARVDGGSTRIDIHDNGPGILPDVQDRIFIPFFTTKREGSGIGLALSRRIMRLHNGTLSVASAPRDTTFTMRFLSSSY
jgi:nitrogen fixation/metabolism regulation signal transduction histidine kinase